MVGVPIKPLAVVAIPTRLGAVTSLTLIAAGNLSLLTVPVYNLEASISPSNLVAVTIPVPPEPTLTFTLPNTVNAGSDAPGLAVVLIPIFDTV